MQEMFTSDQHQNWLFEKYYAAGSNSRYYTFQLVLNLLTQYKKNHFDPGSEITIVETGCQRQKDDLGAGMSTAIFAEWASRHGGHVISVDNFPPHLEICKECVLPWESYVTLVCADSVGFLQQWDIDRPIDLLYLDSLDYPVGEQDGDPILTQAAQQHCLNEFKAIESKLSPFSILMSDDNQLPGGGKPKLLKEYLYQRDWTCLLDFQQTVWVQQLR